MKLADLMERDQDKLAAVESLNSGKGIRIARYVAACLYLHWEICADSGSERQMLPIQSLACGTMLV